MRRLKFKKSNYKYIAIVAVVILLGVLFRFMLFPVIKLNGGRKYFINYPNKFVEPGYKASIRGKDITNLVKVSGSVNNKKLGKYKLVYKVNNYKIERIVEVGDRVAPTINLPKGDIYVCPSKKFSNTYKVVDNYDGDITNKLEIEEFNKGIRFKAVDSHNNKMVVERGLHYKDVEPPVVSLKGNKCDTMYLNSNYDDPGVIAKDNCSVVEIKKTNNIDNTKLGKYSVNYNVCDIYGNCSKLVREVSVISKPVPGTVYLTFDDGPSGYTTDILNTLQKYGVHATFFVTGYGSDQVLLREKEDGHAIGVHTFTHDYAKLYASRDAFWEDFYKAHDRVKRVTGIDTKILRFPGGSSNTISRRYTPGIMSYLVDEVHKRGYKYYDWNISSGDAVGGKIEADTIYKNVINNSSLNRTNMVLMHDTKRATRDALPRIIETLKSRGYTFAKIDENVPEVKQRVNN